MKYQEEEEQLPPIKRGNRKISGILEAAALHSIRPFLG